MAPDQKEDECEESELPAEDRTNGNHEAHWFKKRKKTYDDYQRPMATTKKGLMLGMHTVAAHEHHNRSLQPLMEG